MSKVGWLYSLARLLRDIEVLLSASPKKIGKRLVNKAIGRKLVRRVWWK